MAEAIKICLNCAYSRDWCCSPKRRKGFISCVFDLSKAPKELHHNSNCINFKLKNATGE